MAIRNDYILDMIARFVDALMAGIGKDHGGEHDSALDAYENVVGDVFDMDADALLELSPASLVTMAQLSALDESLVAYAVYALGRASVVYEMNDDGLGQVRRAQAKALADAYGFDPDTIPPELAEAIDKQKRSS